MQNPDYWMGAPPLGLVSHPDANYYYIHLHARCIGLVPCNPGLPYPTQNVKLCIHRNL